MPYMFVKVTNFRHKGTQFRARFNSERYTNATHLKRAHASVSALTFLEIIFLNRAVYWLSNDVKIVAFQREMSPGEVFKRANPRSDGRHFREPTSANIVKPHLRNSLPLQLDYCVLRKEHCTLVKAWRFCSIIEQNLGADKYGKRPQEL